MAGDTGLGLVTHRKTILFRIHPTPGSRGAAACAGALGVAQTKEPTPKRRHPCRTSYPPVYCGCGSDRRLVSSCMSTATLASAFACSRPWCAQKSSSPEFASSTRTYAWAPQRSQTSNAVSGLVGAMAPVNVAFLASCLRLLVSHLAFVLCPYSSAQHIPRRLRSPLRVVYATSETGHRRSVAASAIDARTPPGTPRTPVNVVNTGDTQAPCDS
jgi:hypothetical protein